MPLRIAVAVATWDGPNWWRGRSRAWRLRPGRRTWSSCRRSARRTCAASPRRFPTRGCCSATRARAGSATTPSTRSARTPTSWSSSTTISCRRLTISNRSRRCSPRRPELAGATGDLIADGVRDQGYSVEEAERLIAENPGRAPYEIAMEALYGCNMCVSVGHLGGLRFDENLPLYGWQEDIDFTFQLGARGQLDQEQPAERRPPGRKGRPHLGPPGSAIRRSPIRSTCSVNGRCPRRWATA